ncbi:hypothetical protein [Lysobacter fragariae]
MNAKNTILLALTALLGLAAWKLLPLTSRSESEPAQTQSLAAERDTTALDMQAPDGSDTPNASVAPVVRSPASTAGGAGDAKARLFGSPFEASLLTDGLVNDRAIQLLEAKDFDQVVDQLDAQNSGQRNTIGDKYRAQIENTLASFRKQAQLDRLACGVNVCVASITDREPGTWFNDWYDNIQSAATLPIGALSMFDVDLPGGTSEHRILFTTRPESAGFIVKPVPRH